MALAPVARHTMVSSEDFQSIVLAIHRAALEPKSWQTVLDLLAQVSGGAHTHLFGHDMQRGEGLRLDGALYDPSFMRSYDRYYNRLNAWVPGFAGASVGVPMLTRRLLSNDLFERTEFYNDWIRPQGDILGGCGMMILNEHGRMIAIGGNIRRKDIDRIEADFVDLVGRLAPHLRLALDVAQRVGELHIEREAMLSGVSGTAALFIVAEDGTLIFANRAGFAELKTELVVRLTGASRVTMADGTAAEAVRMALRRPPHARGLAMALNTQAGIVDLRLVAVDPESVPTLAPPLFGANRTPAALLALDWRKTDRNPAAESLARMGLTNAEVSVALMLAEGLDATEIAIRRGSRQTTVRNQIKAVLFKTGSRRQAEVVALIHGLMRQGRDRRGW